MAEARPGSRARLTIAALWAAFVSGCVPAPRTPLAIARHSAPPFATVRTALTKAGLHAGAWPATRWWLAFHDPELTQLITEGLRANGDIQVALAHARAARDRYRVAVGQTGLAVDATGDVERERASATGLIPPPFAGTTFNYANLGLDAHYDLAYWDRQHAALKAAIGERRASRAEAAEVRLIVSTAIAARYWDLASAASHAHATEARLQVGRRIESLVQARFKAGIANAIDYENAQARLAQARLSASAARIRLQQARFALAALLGRGPQFASTIALPRTEPLPALSFPHHIRLDLIARRPDIQARYWQVQASIAGRAAARARYYPDISLGAAWGFQSITLTSLIRPANIAAAIGPAINLPLFGSGERRANLSASRAGYDAAVARYNATIVHAANHVAYALEGLASARHQWRDAQIRSNAADHAFALIHARQAAGIVGALPVRLARLDVLAARDAQSETRIGVLKAWVAVIRNLGGGYHAPASGAR
ncbi:MAG TPA: efflux transporter outer membrane subunit [Acidiferrobacter sp.]|nr:efflux transporter outer membrane subunit [Acidiferrobacter sp.]